MTDVGFATLGVIPSVRGLRAELEKQTSTFESSGRAAGKRYGDAVGKGAGSRLKTSMKSALLPVSGILAGLGGARIFGDMIAEAQEAAKVGKITAQLIKTTGGAANLSAAQVGNLATSLSKYAAVDDELIQGGANLLLTFKNVRNEVGKGNDIFSRATKASLDLSTVLGGDMKSSALQLGKALNDPVKGITSLARAGVQFSADQKTQIKNFVASNDLLSAQKLILGEVERQVGGAAGANATDLDRLSVSFKNLEEAAGTAAAPALNKFAQVATNDLIPALEGAGGFVGDAAHAFGTLPGPIKAAAGAFLVLKVASASAIGTTLASGATSAASALATLRLKAMFAADAYRSVAASSAGAAAGNGRLAASFVAVRAGAAGAGAAMTTGLRGALALVGGPWGVALLAGVGILTHFWQEHQKAKQRVEDFTAAIKADSGAIGENTKQSVVNTLEKDGLLKKAQQLGFSLQTVTAAAMGSKPAMDALNAGLQGFKDAAADAADKGAINGQQMQANVIDAQGLIGSIQGTSGAIADSSAAYKRQSEAMGKSAAAQDKASTATGTYVDKVKAARDAVKGLLDAENKRRNANLGILGDQIALNQAIADARDEAKKGKATLDLTTQAGRDNAGALRDLADAWNGSAGKVKNAKGAYAEMRQNFIDVAIKMGDTKTEARKLADQLLDIPKRSATEITTPGMKAALKALKEARDVLAAIHNFRLEKIVITAQGIKNRGNKNTFATGGMIGGRGSGTSDSNLIFASRGEFMQRKAAVDYYGSDFMAALNNLQVPRFAGGGPIGPVATSSTVALGTDVRGVLSIDRDGHVFLSGVARSVVAEDARTRMVNRRRSSSDGFRRP